MTSHYTGSLVGGRLAGMPAYPVATLFDAVVGWHGVNGGREDV